MSGLGLPADTQCGQAVVVTHCAYSEKKSSLAPGTKTINAGGEVRGKEMTPS